MARKGPSTYEVRVGPQGRIVIPADLRQTLGFQPGAALVALPEDGRLVLQRREGVLARLKARFANIPADVDLAAELIAERRAEAQREAT